MQLTPGEKQGWEGGTKKEDEFAPPDEVRGEPRGEALAEQSHVRGEEKSRQREPCRRRAGGFTPPSGLADLTGVQGG